MERGEEPASKKARTLAAPLDAAPNADEEALSIVLRDKGALSERLDDLRAHAKVNALAHAAVRDRDGEFGRGRRRGRRRAIARGQFHVDIANRHGALAVRASIALSPLAIFSIDTCAQHAAQAAPVSLGGAGGAYGRWRRGR